jgi:putative lipoprotein
VGEAVVTGEVRCRDRAADLRGAKIVVRVEESSRADAPSTVVAEAVLTDPWVADGRAPFSLLVPEVDPRASYRVTALVDLDGDGEVGRGDYLNVSSFPVLTRGHGTHILVDVQRVD